MRISRKIHSRCTANVLALEARDGDRIVDQVIMVSCDLCVIRPGIQDSLVERLDGRLPGFDMSKLFMAATHTHAAPVLLQDRYQGYGDAMQPKDYVKFMIDRTADAVQSAWESRTVGAVAWGLGHAVVGCNRRPVFSDGTAVMYGDTKSPRFREVEGSVRFQQEVTFVPLDLNGHTTDEISTGTTLTLAPRIISYLVIR